MTYVSKKEKVFDLPEQDEASATSLRPSEIRLKQFPSVSDRRAWTLEECQRYQHFYGLVNGSETNVTKSSGFKYIPFDVLLAILMAEKDAYIQELLERQDDRSCGGKAKVLYKAEGFEDSDDDREALIRKDAEVVALKNKIASLESELEDYRKTLTKAMHKLESMDAMISENKLLREKIIYSEETVKCLEKRKRELESELEFYKKHSQNEFNKTEHFPGDRLYNTSGDSQNWSRLSSERDTLLHQVEHLQKELIKLRNNAAEVEVLRKLTETTSNNLEVLSKENQFYKKKLESMKCLEKHIEDLKRQAHTLTDKYKRESQKANDQLKQMNVSAKELEALRQERDKLQERVQELIAYENQYMCLQSKLQEVKIIIDENETLNKKLVQLDRLELENEQLKLKVDQLKCAEVQAAEDKERIMHLQCAVIDQEEEIQKMLRQIKELSDGYVDKNELQRIRHELSDKNEKLRQYEMQLEVIPALESEIDELRNKLQKCIDDFKSEKDLLERLQDELEACQRRCHELEEMTPLYLKKSDEELWEETTSTIHDSKNYEISFTEKGQNTIEISKRDSESQCSSLECKDESSETALSYVSFKKIEDLEEQNFNLKEEVDILLGKLSSVDYEGLLAETSRLKETLLAKEKSILELEYEVMEIRNQLKDYEKDKDLKKNLSSLESQVKDLKEQNCLLESELESTRNIAVGVKSLENSLNREKKAREFAMNTAKELEIKLQDEKEKCHMKEMVTKLQKEEANFAKQETYRAYSKETETLKSIIRVSKTLIQELKRENKLLRDLKERSNFSEKTYLKELVRKFRAEIMALRSLSKPELQRQCESLQNQVRRLLNETDCLVGEINNLKTALQSEKVSKDYLEKELVKLQGNLSDCVIAGSEILKKEIEAKDSTILSLQKELQTVKKDLDDAKKDLENSMNDAEVLRDEKVQLFNNYNNLKSQQNDLESELNWLVVRIEELNKTIKEQEGKENQDTEEINSLREKLSVQSTELIQSQESAQSFRERIKELEDVIRGKDIEMEEWKKKFSDMKQELNRLVSEMDVLKTRLTEKYFVCDSEANYKKDVEEKQALEMALRSVEEELNKLKTRVKECREMEDQMTILKTKKDSLLEKMSGFETEIEVLCKKVKDFERLKDEIEQLRAEKRALAENLSEYYKNMPTEASDLCRQLQQTKEEGNVLKLENDSLKEKLFKAENLLEVSKVLHETIPENSESSTLPEFFTPPILLSPRSSSPLAVETETQNMITAEIHKKELSELENFYKDKIQRLKETHSEKVRKLVLHHEREAKCRSKSFYESINTIKSSYENDIRKLVEKHKTSIMRLQGLHEDEVQELNTNYETQMEAMQTQNENLINDLRTESVEKCKRINEQHNLDLKELKLKYEEVLREKEAQFLLEKAVVETSFAENTNEVKDVHKQAVDSLTQFYQSSIMELEEKHTKELKKCKKSNLKRIELMKNKYDDLLVEERKKYEEQLEEMLRQLSRGDQGDVSESEVKNFIQKKATSTPSNGRLEFTEILQKIINEGLESLTFEELTLVHSKTCFLPGKPIERTEDLSKVIGDGCGHRNLMEAEKEELLKRIFTLEHEIIIKELETQEAIVNMETAEKYRIQELKNALCTAQQKNLELKRLVSNHKLQRDLQIERYILDKQTNLHEGNVIEKLKEIEKDGLEKRRLEEELQKEKTNVKHLTATLEAEKERFRSQRKRDSEYVDSMRLRLEEALNHEQLMESQLDYEARFRAKLESELQSLQKSFNLIADIPTEQIPGEVKAVKDLKSLNPCESTKGNIHCRSKSKHRSKSKGHTK